MEDLAKQSSRSVRSRGAATGPIVCGHRRCEEAPDDGARAEAKSAGLCAGEPPDASYRLTPAAIIEVKDDREVYLVTPNMAQGLPGEFSTVTLFTTISRQGTLHLWPVKLPAPDGRHNEWHRSAAEAAERAMKNWVRVTASMSLGAYEIFEASGDLPEPVWPDFSFPEILRIAFRERIVDRPDHALVQRLRGIV